MRRPNTCYDASSASTSRSLTCRIAAGFPLCRGAVVLIGSCRTGRAGHLPASPPAHAFTRIGSFSVPPRVGLDPLGRRTGPDDGDEWHFPKARSAVCARRSTARSRNRCSALAGSPLGAAVTQFPAGCRLLATSYALTRIASKYPKGRLSLPR